MKNANESVRAFAYLKLADTLAKDAGSDIEEVEKNYSLAIESGADVESVLIRWSDFLKKRNLPVEAIERLQSNRWNFEKSRDFFFCLANLYSSMDRHEEAAENYRAAIERDPGDAILSNNLGITLFRLKQFDEAEKFLLNAIISNEEYHLAYRNIIHLYSETNRFEDALPFCEKYYSINPGRASAELFSKIVRRIGDFERLREFVGEHVADHEGSAALYADVAGLAFETGEAAESYSFFIKAAELAPTDFSHRSNALLSANHFWQNPNELFSEHVRLCSELKRTAVDAGLGSLESTRKKAKGAKKRVGYLSTDFKRHAVMQIFGACLNAHDCEKIDYFIYNLNSKSDAVSESLKKSLGEIGFQWRDIAGKDLHAIKSLAQSDQIDLMIDLSAHTAGGHTVPLLANKLAPLQATYLGYPNTTGLREVDYRITDPIADPVGMTESIHSEKLIRIEAPFLCIQRPDALPKKILSPCLTNGYLTFGYFNKLLKLTDATLSLWGRLFDQNPTARLLIKAGGLQYSSTKVKLSKRLSECGIPVDRVRFLPQVDNHLEQYNKVDICLDPFPYNGAVNSIEALWMGVPVLTLAGNSHVSRVGASLLTSIGFGEFVAETEEQYLRICNVLSDDLSSTAAYKRRIRDALEVHSATDPAVLFKKLEDAYLAMLSDIIP